MIRSASDGASPFADRGVVRIRRPYGLQVVLLAFCVGMALFGLVFLVMEVKRAMDAGSVAGLFVDVAMIVFAGVLFSRMNEEWLLDSRSMSSGTVWRSSTEWSAVSAASIERSVSSAGESSVWLRLRSGTTVTSRRVCLADPKSTLRSPDVAAAVLDHVIAYVDSAAIDLDVALVALFVHKAMKVAEEGSERARAVGSVAASLRVGRAANSMRNTDLQLDEQEDLARLLGVCEYLLGRADDAMTLAHRVLVGHPDDLEALTLKAACLARLGRVVEATKAAQQAERVANEPYAGVLRSWVERLSSRG